MVYSVNLMADYCSEKMEHFICNVIINEKQYDQANSWRVIRNINAIRLLILSKLVLSVEMVLL